MLLTFRANTRSHPSFSGKLFGHRPKRDDKGGQQARASRSVLVGVLVERRAPRHARVVDEDMDLALLGLDRVDEAVAPSLGLDIEHVAYVRAVPVEN